VKTFRDVNTYCAYCYLLSRCWDEIRDETPANTIQRTLREFTTMICREAAICSVHEAREWLTVLRLEPWDRHLRGKWCEVLTAFSDRIDTALQAACNGSSADAATWIDFLGEQAHEETRSWLAERLSSDRLAALPTRLAKQVFEVLEAVAPPAEQNEASLMRDLAKLGSSHSGNLWDSREFREALWACLTGREDRHDRTWACLKQVLDRTFGNLEEFKQWVDISLELERLGVQLGDLESSSPRVRAGRRGQGAEQPFVQGGEHEPRLIPVHDAGKPSPWRSRNLAWTAIIVLICGGVVILLLLPPRSEPKASVIIVRASSSLATGFLIDQDHDNYALFATCRHVVEDMETGHRYPVLTISFQEQPDVKIRAEVFKVSPTHDLAILRTDGVPTATELPHALNLGSSETLEDQEPLTIIGHPKGDLHKAIPSHVLKVDRQKITLDGFSDHGCSGGPALNRRHEVVGIVYVMEDGPTSRTFAVPVEELKNLLKMLRQ